MIGSLAKLPPKIDLIGGNDSDVNAARANKRNTNELQCSGLEK